MTGEPLLVDYDRAGGREPSDDERLDLWPNGRYTARRTVGATRIGSFAGRLEAPVLDEIASLAAAAGAAGDLQVQTPMDGATESIRVGECQARMGSNERPEGPWGALAERLREVLGGVATRSPVAALELLASPSEARLSHAGSEPLEVDVASVSVRAVRLDAQGLVLGRWRGSAGEPQVEDAAPAGSAAEWTEAAAGWELPLPFRHGLELAPDDWLQVWVFVRLREAGAVRAGRLFAAVSGGSAAVSGEAPAA